MLMFKGTLRFFSEEMSLDEISSVLGAPSQGSFSKGEYWRKDKYRQYSLWRFQSGELEHELDDVIENILEKYESFGCLNKDFIEKCKIDIFCMASSDNGQGALNLSVDLMSRLVEHSIPINFDVYANPDD